MTTTAFTVMLKTALWLLIFYHGKIPTCCTKISSLVEKGKVYQEREYPSQRQGRKWPNNGREEKSLKDAGQFLGCKKVLSN